MDDKQRLDRRAHVRVAVWLTRNTPLAQTPYERKLFRKYVCGMLTLKEVLALAEAGQPTPKQPPLA